MIRRASTSKKWRFLLGASAAVAVIVAHRGMNAYSTRAIECSSVELAFMPAVQQAREHRTNAKTRGDGLYSMGFSWFDCEPQAHEQLRYKKRQTYPLPSN